MRPSGTANRESSKVGLTDASDGKIRLKLHIMQIVGGEGGHQSILTVRQASALLLNPVLISCVFPGVFSSSQDCIKQFPNLFSPTTVFEASTFL